jgi:hypothetical protein
LADFEITKCHLAQEVIPLDGAPSPAAGVVMEVFEAELEATHRIVWLLEPLRNSSVTHYTGTMDHPAGQGQLAHTLSAFVHYSFQWSEGTIVFADIQGIHLSSFLYFVLISRLIYSKVPREDSVQMRWASSSST